jgi:hypothetical protein
MKYFNKDKLPLAIVLTTSLFLVACGGAAQVGARVTGYSTHCVDGVKYIQFLNGASVMYNRDGTVKTCEK